MPLEEMSCRTCCGGACPALDVVIDYPWVHPSLCAEILHRHVSGAMATSGFGTRPRRPVGKSAIPPGVVERDACPALGRPNRPSVASMSPALGVERATCYSLSRQPFRPPGDACHRACRAGMATCCPSSGTYRLVDWTDAPCDFWAKAICPAVMGIDRFRLGAVRRVGSSWAPCDCPTFSCPWYCCANHRVDGSCSDVLYCERLARRSRPSSDVPLPEHPERRALRFLPWGLTSGCDLGCLARSARPRHSTVLACWSSARRPLGSWPWLREGFPPPRRPTIADPARSEARPSKLRLESGTCQEFSGQTHHMAECPRACSRSRIPGQSCFHAAPPGGFPTSVPHPPPRPPHPRAPAPPKLGSLSVCSCLALGFASCRPPAPESSRTCLRGALGSP
eukprot:scaffold1467_cov264-Pinguiococcus_pyrenoidosus.AAC.20